MTKSKILTFLTRTQKATAALVSATAAVSAATFIPAPWGGYAATAGLVLVWLMTYVFPFVSQAVEAFPEEVGLSEPAESAEPLEGEIIEPETDEIPVQDQTAGIPVIVDDTEHEFVPPFTGAISVNEVLRRLAAEESASV